MYIYVFSATIRMQHNDTIWVRNEAMQKFCDMWNRSFWVTVKKEISLSLSQGGVFSLFDRIIKDKDSFFSSMTDQAQAKKTLEDRKETSLTHDNYLILSVEKITDPKKFKSDIDEKEAVIAKIWLRRDYAQKMYDMLIKDPSADIDLSRMNDSFRWDQFTWRLILDYTSMKRTLFWVMSQSWLSLDYTDVWRHSKKIIDERHQEKMQAIERIVKHDGLME